LKLKSHDATLHLFTREKTMHMHRINQSINQIITRKEAP